VEVGKNRGESGKAVALVKTTRGPKLGEGGMGHIKVKGLKSV